MTRRRERGYSLLEVVVMLAVFGALLAIFFILTAEMRRWEKRLPVNYMKHPQVSAVMARLKKDVLDAHLQSGPYLEEAGDFTDGPKTLIVATILEVGTIETVVWDFSKPGIVQRHAFTSGFKSGTWTARGVPVDFSKQVGISAVEFEDRPYGVRIQARDDADRIAIDLILQPRSHFPAPPEPPDPSEEVPTATAT